MFFISYNFKRIKSVDFDIFVGKVFELICLEWIDLIQGSSDSFVFDLSFEGLFLEFFPLSLTFCLNLIDFFLSILAQVASPWQESVWNDAVSLAYYLVSFEKLVHISLNTSYDVLDLYLIILLGEGSLKFTHLLSDLVGMSAKTLDLLW